MKISIGNQLCPILGDLEQRYAVAAEMGFGAMDLQINEWSVGQIYKNEAFGFFDRSMEELIEYYGAFYKEAKKHGIEMYQMHAPFPSACINTIELNPYIEMVFKKCIRICAAVECKYMVAHPIRTGDRVHVEKDFEANLKLFSTYIDDLKENGVMMCLENCYHYFNGRITSIAASNSAFLLKLVETLNEMAGEECFGICYDTGHANITGKDHYQEILAYGKHLKVLHLHDTDGVHDSHLIPYTGRYLDRQATDWEGILMALAEIGYEGSLNFEMESGITAFPVEARADAMRLAASIGKAFVSKIEKYRASVANQ